MKFDDALGQMLFGGLVSYGHAREFDISDEVARFFANRANDHIQKINGPVFVRYSAGVRAIAAIPRFFDRVEIQMNAKKFPNIGGADKLIQDLTSSTLGSVWPFCTNVPGP